MWGSVGECGGMLLVGWEGVEMMEFFLLKA